MDTDNRLCINCRYVKRLDSVVGRCLAVKGRVFAFCKLKEPGHVCEDFKLAKEVKT